MRGKSVLLTGLFFTSTALAQGTFLYTWHGNSGLFQGSFEVMAEENQPGQYFESQTFYDSIRFVSPDDTFTYSYFYGSGLHDEAEGTAGPLSLQFILYDNNSGRELAAGADSSWAAIYEFNQPGGSQLWAEGGYWSSAYVPEPSGSVLIALGVGAVSISRALTRFVG